MENKTKRRFGVPWNSILVVRGIRFLVARGIRLLVARGIGAQRATSISTAKGGRGCFNEALHPRVVDKNRPVNPLRYYETMGLPSPLSQIRALRITTVLPHSKQRLWHELPSYDYWFSSPLLFLIHLLCLCIKESSRAKTPE